MKKPLLTIMGALLLSNAPLAIGEETVTISVKDLKALKSLCSSINGATTSSAAASSTAAVASSAPTASPSPAIGKVIKIASLRGFHDLDKEAKPVEKGNNLK